MLDRAQMSAERLQKLLAHAGVASRRAAEKMISEGRVRVNGRIVTELGARADARNDRIEVDGKRYAIEHVENGRFNIHYPGGQRHAALAEHFNVLSRLVSSEPAKWVIEDRSRRAKR